MTVTKGDFNIRSSSINHNIIIGSVGAGILIIGKQNLWDNISSELYCLHRWRFSKSDSERYGLDCIQNIDDDYVCNIIGIDLI